MTWAALKRQSIIIKLQDSIQNTGPLDVVFISTQDLTVSDFKGFCNNVSVPQQVVVISQGGEVIAMAYNRELAFGMVKTAGRGLPTHEACGTQDFGVGLFP